MKALVIDVLVGMVCMSMVDSEGIVRVIAMTGFIVSAIGAWFISQRIAVEEEGEY